MTNINTNEVRAAIATACFNAALLGKETGRVKSSLGAQVSELYRSIPAGDKVAFEAEFGNGLPPKSKEYKAGALQEALALASNLHAAEWLAKERKAVKLTGEAKKLIFGQLETAAAQLAKLAAAQLKSRKTECREAFKTGLVVGESETVQSALNKAKAKKANGANQHKADGKKVTIEDGATMEDIANALSVWVAKHGSAAHGLAAKLKDFLPVTVSTRKAA
jgi:hypothetical protein